MLRFLFWNIRKRNLGRYVALATEERKIDCLVVSECINPLEILRELHRVGLKNFNHHDNPTKAAVEIFSQLPLDRIRPLGDYGCLTFRRVLPIIGKEFLLVGAHLHSKLRRDEADQALYCTTLAAKIVQFESAVGHKRTVIIGDLNMNPFERGVVTANGFHAAPTKTVAKRGSRVVDGEKYGLFYNPMWSLFGGRDGGPPGTYFYDKSRLTEYFWHMFDQVLVRPDLVDHFDSTNLEIIANIGGTNLLDSDGRPDAKELSDHLPIAFSLDLTKETI